MKWTNPFLPVLQERIEQWSDIQGHLTFLYNLVRAMKPHCILDVGVRDGFSTIAFLVAAHETRSLVISIDIAPCAETQAFIKDQGLGPYWTFFQGNSVEVLKDLLSPKRLGPGSVDLALSDTSHEYAQTLEELKAIDPLLRLGGILLVHDTHSDYKDVPIAIEDFLKETPNTYSIFDYEHSYGLAVLRKLNKGGQGPRGSHRHRLGP